MDRAVLACPGARSHQHPPGHSRSSGSATDQPHARPRDRGVAHDHRWLDQRRLARRGPGLAAGAGSLGRWAIARALLEWHAAGWRSAGCGSGCTHRKGGAPSRPGAPDQSQAAEPPDHGELAAGAAATPHPLARAAPPLAALRRPRPTAMLALPGATETGAAKSARLRGPSLRTPGAPAALQQLRAGRAAAGRGWTADPAAQGGSLRDRADRRSPAPGDSGGGGSG